MTLLERSRRRTGRGDRASASVEFALVLPLLLIVTLALVQVGFIAKDQLVLEEAARAGAREAAVSTDDSAARDAAVRAASSLDRSRLDVAVAREGGNGTPVEVAVTYHDAVVIPLVSWLFPASIELHANATMRQEE